MHGWPARRWSRPTGWCSPARCAAPDSITGDALESIARTCVRDIGYEQEGFHWAKAAVEVHVHAQSADIALGVDQAGNKDQGAGDQGIMFGYACRETDALMPAPLHYAHAILAALARARHAGDAPGLGPDSKSQVTLRYEDGVPVGATSVVVSTQHAAELSQDDVREIVRPYVVAALPDGWMCDEKWFYVNPTGRFVIGGPDGDAGVTGRKIIVDTYGGAAPHGGGAFSGKDPSKVDRSRSLCGALPREERRRRQSRVPLHDSARLRDRRRPSARGLTSIPTAPARLTKPGLPRRSTR